MSDFLYLYRLPSDSKDHPESPNEMQQRLAKWHAWFKDLQAQGVVKNLGNALTSGGAVVHSPKGAIQDGPYVESKDIVVGFTVVDTRDLAHASELARGCPVFEYGGRVEVRPIHGM